MFEEFKAAARLDGMLAENAATAFYNSFLGATGPFLAIDGGAHRGLHTFRLLAVENCKFVIGVEANRQLSSDLTKAVSKKRLTGQVDVVHGALQDDPSCEFVQFHISPTHPGRSGIDTFWLDDPNVEFNEPVSVPSTTIDLLAGTRDEAVGFIKLDLEGGEFAALRGASDVLKKDRPCVVFENGNRSLKRAGYTESDFVGFFQNNGYTLISFDGSEVGADDLYRFWYAIAVPDEEAQRASGLIKSAVQRTFQTQA